VQMALNIAAINMVIVMIIYMVTV